VAYGGATDWSDAVGRHRPAGRHRPPVVGRISDLGAPPALAPAAHARHLPAAGTRTSASTAARLPAPNRCQRPIVCRRQTVVGAKPLVSDASNETRRAAIDVEEKTSPISTQAVISTGPSPINQQIPTPRPLPDNPGNPKADPEPIVD
jgi:hypothetical protein